MVLKFLRKGRFRSKKKRQDSGSFRPASTTRNDAERIVFAAPAPDPFCRQCSSDEASIVIAKDWLVAYEPMRNDPDPIVRERTLDPVGLDSITPDLVLLDRTVDSFRLARRRIESSADVYQDVERISDPRLETYWCYEDQVSDTQIQTASHGALVERVNRSYQDISVQAHKGIGTQQDYDSHQEVRSSYNTKNPRKSLGIFKAYQGMFELRSWSKPDLTASPVDGNANQSGPPSNIKTFKVVDDIIAAAGSVSASTLSTSSFATIESEDDVDTMVFDEDSIYDEDMEEWDEAILECISCRRC